MCKDWNGRPGTYQLDPSAVVVLAPRLGARQVTRLRSIHHDVGALGPARLGQLGLLTPAEVERAEHGDVDADPGEHELDGAQHEGHEGRAGQVAHQVDDEDLPEANNANDDAAVDYKQASVCCSVSVRIASGGRAGNPLTRDQGRSRRGWQTSPSCASAAPTQLRPAE